MERFKPELLPDSGRHLIEASAGTGKTYALMSLMMRALAVDGHQPDNLTDDIHSHQLENSGHVFGNS